MRPLFAFFFLFGLLAFAVSLYGAIFLDWPALQKADAAFRQATPRADLRTLFVLESRQNIHRINLLDEGIWCLLSAVLSVVSVAFWNRFRLPRP